MCGIFGVLTQFEYVTTGITSKALQQSKECIKELMFLSEERGTDSTGILAIDKGNSAHFRAAHKITMYKAAMSASTFVDTEGFKNILKSATKTTVALVGHTRQKTHGTPLDNRNNHPHKSGYIFGVHNGIISNFKKLVKEESLTLLGKCDSEVIFALIEKFLKEAQSITKGTRTENVSHPLCYDDQLIYAVRKTAAKLVGSYACFVVNAEKANKVILFRNGSPLHIRALETEKQLLFASRSDYLRKAYEKIDKGHENFNRLVKLKLPRKSGMLVDLGFEYKANTSWSDRFKTFTL
ncbi:MAG TPA: hypothetical protein ENI23_00100 [bacterium]|nr:hypothetical protein [bacterium]